MLRAGTTGLNPIILAGLTEENINRLKNGFPIKAPLETFSPGMRGDLLIFYGRTHEDLEKMVKVGENTQRSSSARVEQEEAARRDHERILICTVGLPRSGKTTWARSQAWPIVNPDSIRLAIHGQRFVSDAEPFVWATAKVMVRALFLAGHQTVILDATNSTRKRRSEWFDERWATFFKVIGTSKEECLSRANDDAEIHPVIERMAAQWEPLDESCKRW